MAHLTASVHAGISSTSHRHLRGVTAQGGPERGLELALNGALVRLASPAGELRPVVPEVDADADEPAVPVGGGGLSPQQALARLQDSSSLGLPGSASTASKPAASAASGVANQTPATVTS